VDLRSAEVFARHPASDRGTRIDGEQETEKRSARDIRRYAVAEIEPGRASTVNILRGEMGSIGPRPSACVRVSADATRLARFLTGQWQERPDYGDRVALGSYYVLN
jgi:hypothetical protein